MVVVRSLDKSGNSSRSNSIVSDDYCLVEELEEFNSRGEPATTTAALINSAEKERSGLEEKVKQVPTITGDLVLPNRVSNRDKREGENS